MAEDHDHEALVALYGDCPRCTHPATYRPAPASGPARPARPKAEGFRCELCGEPIDPRASTTFRRMECWVRYRTGKSPQHALRAHNETRLAHSTCVDAAKSSAPPTPPLFPGATP